MTFHEALLTSGPEFPHCDMEGVGHVLALFRSPSNVLMDLDTECQYPKRCQVLLVGFRHKSCNYQPYNKV